MKIYILADMEGISGIRMIEQVQRDKPEYAQGCRLMMDDVNVAVDACFDAGADEVLVCDTHGGGGQLELEKMDPRATYETPNNGVMMPGLDDSFDGVILLGHHARAGTLNGFLDHTMSSQAWFECRINDVVVGEVGVEAAWAGWHDVPVIAVTGDEAVATEATQLLEKVECAAVKRGIGRNRARCDSIETAHEKIRETIRKAISEIEKARPYTPKSPVTFRITYYRSDMADEKAKAAEWKRIDARTVEREMADFRDFRL
ncbi:MAG: M55 family metallopeptidase [bacterium]